jgi:hypothetical protein
LEKKFQTWLNAPEEAAQFQGVVCLYMGAGFFSFF